MHDDYCPVCFAPIPHGSAICPACGVDIDAWTQKIPYAERLIHSLRNPHPEVRMGAIISLGRRRDPMAARPLADCALAHPVDVVEALEVVRALRAMADQPEAQEALMHLAAGHPAHAVRESAGEALDIRGRSFKEDPWTSKK